MKFTMRSTLDGLGAEERLDVVVQGWVGERHDSSGKGGSCALAALESVPAKSSVTLSLAAWGKTTNPKKMQEKPALIWTLSALSSQSPGRVEQTAWTSASGE